MSFSQNEVLTAAALNAAFAEVNSIRLPVDPTDNKEWTAAWATNTTLRFRLRGDDGVVRFLDLTSGGGGGGGGSGNSWFPGGW